jgi:hypothetical protein
VLSDEQLIQRLRVALEQETANIEPPPGLLAAVPSPPIQTTRRWPGRAPRLGQALIGLAAAGALAIAALALALLGHTRRQPVPVSVHTEAAARPSVSPPRAGQPLAPARVSAASVSAPLRLRALPVAHYCDGPGLVLVLCRPGQRPLVVQPQRLLELSVLARRAAGRHSWYAWSVTAPRQCPAAGAGGPTRGTVPAGTRLVFDSLIAPGCRGTVKVTVLYVSQAPAADSERFALVGRGSMTLP